MPEIFVKWGRTGGNESLGFVCIACFFDGDFEFDRIEPCGCGDHSCTAHWCGYSTEGWHMARRLHEAEGLPLDGELTDEVKSALDAEESAMLNAWGAYAKQGRMDGLFDGDPPEGGRHLTAGSFYLAWLKGEAPQFCYDFLSNGTRWNGDDS